MGRTMTEEEFYAGLHRKIRVLTNSIKDLQDGIEEDVQETDHVFTDKEFDKLDNFLIKLDKVINTLQIAEAVLYE